MKMGRGEKRWWQWSVCRGKSQGSRHWTHGTVEFFVFSFGFCCDHALSMERMGLIHPTRLNFKSPPFTRIVESS